MSDGAKKFEPEEIKTEAPEPLFKKSEFRAPRMDEAATDELREQLKRRRVPRRPVKSAVGILHKGIYQVATCYEIGEGGMLIASDVKLEKDDNVVVTLRIPDVMNGVMIGKVVYAMASEKQEHARYGVMFEKVDFEMKRKIRNYVASATNYVVGGSG